MYIQQFHWRIVHLAFATVFVTDNFQVPCLLTPPTSVTFNCDNIYLCYNWPFFVLERNPTSDAFCLHRQASTACYVFSTVKHVYTTRYGTFYIVVYIQVHVGSLNVPCSAYSQTILYYECVLHQIYRACSSSMRSPLSPVGSLPLGQNA